MNGQPSENTEYTKVELSDGTILRMAYTPKSSDGEEEVGLRDKISFSRVTGAIESMASDISKVWEKVQTQKMSVEFGLEIEADTDDTIMAVIMKGSGKANFKVTLEWQKEKKN